MGYGAPPPPMGYGAPPQMPGYGQGGGGPGKGGGKGSDRTPCGRFKLCATYSQWNKCDRDKCGFAHWNAMTGHVENEADCARALAEWKEKEDCGKGGGRGSSQSGSSEKPSGGSGGAASNGDGLIVVCSKSAQGKGKKEEEEKEESLEEMLSRRRFDHLLPGANGVPANGIVSRRTRSRLREEMNGDVLFCLGTVAAVGNPETSQDSQDWFCGMTTKDGNANGAEGVLPHIADVSNYLIGKGYRRGGILRRCEAEGGGGEEGERHELGWRCQHSNFGG